MFCSNCGKEIEDNHTFCSSCGKAISSNQVTPPIPAKKSTKQKTKNIFISLGVCLVVYLLGYFVISPLISKSYTKDLPTTGSISSNSFEIDNDFSVGINSNAATEEKEENTTVSASTSTGVTKTKIYEIKAEGIMSQQTSFIYSSDGTVKSIIGYVNFHNLNADGVNELINDYDTVKKQIDRSGLSGAKIEVNKTDYSYSLTFSFTGLDLADRTDTAKTAADFMGIPNKNGKIFISETEETMLNAGYSLINEF